MSTWRGISWVNGCFKIHVYVVVQFYPWFKFSFPLFQTHYHTLQYPKTKEKKIWTKDKIAPQHVYVRKKFRLGSVESTYYKVPAWHRFNCNQIFLSFAIFFYLQSCFICNQSFCHPVQQHSRPLMHETINLPG